MKTEANNSEALKDLTIQIRVPSALKTDNAQSELGNTWIKHSRNLCIQTQTTEPHHL